MWDKDLVIKCAMNNGWSPVKNKNITVHRATTIFGSDMGEWWIHQPEVLSIRRVTDIELKAYMRDVNINKLGL
jgi:hypothetical protein